MNWNAILLRVGEALLAAGAAAGAAYTTTNDVNATISAGVAAFLAKLIPAQVTPPAKPA